MSDAACRPCDRALARDGGATRGDCKLNLLSLPERLPSAKVLAAMLGGLDGSHIRFVNVCFEHTNQALIHRTFPGEMRARFNRLADSRWRVTTHRSRRQRALRRLSAAMPFVKAQSAALFLRRSVELQLRSQRRVIRWPKAAVAGRVRLPPRARVVQFHLRHCREYEFGLQ